MRSLEEMESEIYLGDAVYASFDGYQIWLRTADGNNNRIALEPSVYQALVEYVADLKKAAAHRAELDEIVKGYGKAGGDEHIENAIGNLEAALDDLSRRMSRLDEGDN